MVKTLTHSAKQTAREGFKLGARIKKSKKPIILALTGDLGSGKTTFTQGLARGLGIKDRLVSPTFILLRSYPVDSNKTLHHLDLYRLEDPSEILILGISDLWRDPRNIIVIEWAEKISELLPQNTHWIKFSGISHDEREINSSIFI